MAINSISNLKSEMSLRGGFVRSNQYKIYMPSIPGATISSSTLNILCSRVQLPGRQIMTNERRIGLETAKAAYGFANVEVNMAFRETGDYSVRNYFKAWQNLGVDDATNEIGYLRGTGGYGKSVKIIQLDKNDNELYKVELLEAYPTSLNATDLSNSEEGAIVETSVSLSYTKWKEI